MADVKASDINAAKNVTVQPHHHEYQDAYSGYGTDPGDTTYDSDVTDTYVPAAIPDVSPNTPISVVTVQQIEAAVQAMLNHTHTYPDKYGTACNCDCDCNCTRGSL